MNGILSDGIIRRDYSTKESFEGLKEINTIISAKNPPCSGISITSSSDSCTSAGVTRTLTWQPMTETSQYIIAYDDDPNFWQDQQTKQEYGEPVSWHATSRNNWSHTFLDGRKRYFKVRVGQSNNCIADTSAYGATTSTTSTACFATDFNNSNTSDFLDQQVFTSLFNHLNLFHFSHLLINFNSRN